MRHRAGLLPVVAVGTFICLYLFELLPEGRMIHRIITENAIAWSSTIALNNTRGFDHEQDLQDWKQRANEGSLRSVNTTVESGLHVTSITQSIHLLSRNDSASTTVSPLNDQTIPWDTTIHRPWLDPSVPNPPAMIVLTNFAWNHPNQTFGLEQYRGYRTKELLDGIVNHPYFHPTGWEDLNSGRMQISNTTRYYVFLDSETCVEKNYPRYGHGFAVNRDESHGLGGDHRSLFAEEMVASRLYREAALLKFVIFNCGGNGIPKYFAQPRQIFHQAEKCALLHLSSEYQQVMPWDQGLPPPPCRHFFLTAQEEHDIATCNEDTRPILISFAGKISRSATRQRLYQLHNGNDIIVANYMDLQDRIYNRFNTTEIGEGFERLAKASAFSAASRGDNLFSYRFSEVMSCGSIPVVYADDWMLPFGNSLINWTDIVVVIKEDDTNRTAEILSSISKEERCRRRQKVVEIYRKYIESGRGVMSGIIENFELAATQPENLQPPKASYMLPPNVTQTN